MSANTAWRIVLALMVSGILYLSLVPSPPSDGLGWDKANHAAAMAAVTIVAFLSFRPARRAIFFGGLCAMALGAVVEIAQWLFTENRQAEWADLIADALGVIIAMLLLSIWRYRRESVLALLMLAVAQPVMADDALTVSGELKGFGDRIVAESVDYAKTPFTLKDGNIFWTMGIAGAIGLTYSFDGEIRDRIQKNRSRGIDRAADAGEIIGNPYLHLGVAALVYTGGIMTDSPRWKETGEMMAEALFLADAATLLIKEGAGRGRPNVTSRKGDYRPFQFNNDYDSFPSMHTASSFAMASVIARTSESIPIAVASYSAAAFAGFSRMNQNKHWASDVLLGAAIGELAGRVVTHFHADKQRRVVLLPGVSSEAVTMNLLYRF